MPTHASQLRAILPIVRSKVRLIAQRLRAVYLVELCELFAHLGFGNARDARVQHLNHLRTIASCQGSARQGGRACGSRIAHA
jgi:hypothetical protein